MGVLVNIQVYRGGQLVAQHQFDGDTNRTVKIGRLSSAQVKLDDPKVSRIHAVIEIGASDISLHDMGTTEGTSVNGAKVVNAKLKSGDQITVGDSTLVLTTGAAAAASVPAPASATPTAPSSFGSAFGPPPGFGSDIVFGGAKVTAPVVAGSSPGAPSGPSSLAQQLKFDSGGNTGPIPIQRITNQRLGAAAVESRPHPSLPPEDPMTAENRVLEMRLYWGEALLGVTHYDKPSKITIGETKKTNVFISSEGLPTEEFPLVRYMEDDYVLTFTNHMEGELELDGSLVQLQTLRNSAHARKDDVLSESYQMRMAPNSRAIIHWGGATFALRFVSPAGTVPRSVWQNIDLHFVNIALMSLFFHLALTITLLVYPYDTDSLREDLFDKPDRFASLILEPAKQTDSNKNLLDSIKKEIEKKKEELAKEKPPEEKPKLTKQDPLKIKPTIPTRKPTKAEKSAAVREKFSKLFSGGGGGSGAGSLLGGGGGGSLSGTLSNVIGTAGVGSASAGMAGLGIRGTGPLTGGGVGTSRGIAGIGTSGRLGGGGMRYGSNVGLGGRKERGGLDIGPPRIEGALAPEVIKKVIDENRNQIRYCYEVELQRNQNLEGRVAMAWVISATGSVATVSVRDTTLNNKAVEACIAQKIKNWKFPAPAGGGVVTVNYPFIFKAT